MRILLVPFPRPQKTLKNIAWVFLIALTCTVFISIFEPFNIHNQNGEPYYYILLSSMGLVFFCSICFIEFVIPSLLPQVFKKWTLTKALIWYSAVVLFVSVVMFLYKSYLAEFVDFTFQEYLNVLGRVFGITVMVAFFVMGIAKCFNPKSLTFLASNQDFTIRAPNDQPLRLNPKDILYMVSDNNYVDIHTLSAGRRAKITYRSSLKNIEVQIANPLTPIYRCHRSYLINIEYFELKRKTSRKTTIQLINGEDEIPISSKYVEAIINLL